MSLMRKKAVAQPAAPPQPQQTSSPARAELQKAAIVALQSSLSTGIFADSQFYLYSRRARDGAVDTPLPVHASSTVLMQTAEYFHHLLAGGFSEDAHIGLSQAARQSSRKLRRSIAAYDFEYESDSDLDDEIDDALSSDIRTEGGSTHHDVSVGTDPPVLESGGTTSTISAEMHEDMRPEHATTDGWKDEDKDSSMLEPPSIPAYINHTVVIQDVAHRTFRAFVHYAYTGSIEFSALRSIENSKRGTGASENQKTLELACSPKSMYRLADKYGLSELRKLAAKNIKSQLTPEIALSELLSRFTARYPEVITFEIDFICTPGKTLSGSLTNLKAWVDRIVTGELPHAGPALVALIQKLSLMGDDNVY
ncbi:hypothetical protein GY45DRAFT_1336471 [Cubamyces sp. BRFM 1775]|nr:hypothetical protein GY45DRAFT_1336471 [Cubamyces sp. BRFM 1775]